jgi:hypothetical protein
MATMCAVLGIDPVTMRLHKEDALTTHACPGKNVSKSEIIREVQNLIQLRHGNGHII